MNYLEELKSSRSKAVAAYQEFTLLTKRYKDGLFCFYEGKDNAYYVPRIKVFISNYHSINCGGRDKVLEVYSLIIKHNEYAPYKKAFFIDKDFNQPLTPHNPPIFETPCYAIENFYVSADVFRAILKNALRLSEISEAYQTCMALFIARQQEFHQATLLFNAWYACLISLKNSTGKQTGVHLDDKLPRDFVNFSNLKSISANYTLDTIKHTFPNAPDIPQNVLDEKVGEFADCQQHQVFRGKYELWFVIVFIELILQDSTKTKSFLKEKINFSFSNKLSNDQAVELFSSYAETPDSLNRYLQQVTL